MKNLLARCGQAGSFVAGLFIGLSIVVPVFAMMVASPSDWQTFLVFGAPLILALGITLQVVITAKPRHRRTIDTKLGGFPIRLMESMNNERALPGGGASPTTKPGILRSARPRDVAHVAAIFDAGGAI